MPIEVRWSTLARQELLGIYVTLGSLNPGAAERLYDRIEQRARHLANQPRLGQRRPDLRRSARVLVEAPYLILYETVPDTDDGLVTAVEIMSVVDGRRDLTVRP